MDGDGRTAAAQKDIARAILDLRSERGLSQEALAELIHVSRSAIATAETKRATKGVVEQIARVFPEFAPAAETYILSLPALHARKNTEIDELEEMFFARSNLARDLSGEWHALWESTVEGSPILNSELLILSKAPRNRIRIANVAISEENSDAGYLWAADCRLYDGISLLGTYIATENSVRSKGVLQLLLRPSGREIQGQWAGISFDSDFARGLVVMTRRRDELERAMKRLQDRLKSSYN